MTLSRSMQPTQAVKPKGKPTVILAKTIKGYAFGASAEAQNATHSVKKLDIESLKKFRDRFGIPIEDKKLGDVPYYRPAEDNLELRYMKKARESPRRLLFLKGGRRPMH